MTRLRRAASQGPERAPPRLGELLGRLHNPAGKKPNITSPLHNHAVPSRTNDISPDTPAHGINDKT